MIDEPPFGAMGYSSGIWFSPTREVSLTGDTFRGVCYVRWSDTYRRRPS
jgi:hypothetical protein